jgi:hypothetical protein
MRGLQRRGSREDHSDYPERSPVARRPCGVRFLRRGRAASRPRASMVGSSEAGLFRNMRRFPEERIDDAKSAGPPTDERVRSTEACHPAATTIRIDSPQPRCRRGLLFRNAMMRQVAALVKIKLLSRQERVIGTLARTSFLQRMSIPTVGNFQQWFSTPSALTTLVRAH